MPDPSHPTVAVLGCGLIGASVAGALSCAGHPVVGADRRDLTPLIERGWITRQVDADDLAEADVVFLALPPSGVIGALRRLPFRVGQIVTDVVSVQHPVEEAARSLDPGIRFVAGHPMAGGTGSGFEAAREDLFRDAVWVLSEAADPEARETVAVLVRRMGAEPLAVDGAHHDRIVALTSHLPQLLSTALAAEMDGLDDPLTDKLLGPGGRDFLRLARSPYGFWKDVFQLNEEAVSQALTAVTSRAGQSSHTLEDEFAAARRFLRSLDGDHSNP